jgi:DMSO/TMAO reductase YedYZ molybdopterin-dependent catalytic subunit
MNPSRRQLLGTMAAAGVASLVDPGLVLTGLAAQQPCTTGGDPGTLLGTLPLFRSGGQEQPFGVKLGGRGLDARLITDLSTLEPDRLITPNALAFVRTEGPAAASHHDAWTIRTSGLADDRSPLSAAMLSREARSMGPHLLECSGNNNPANFGLMSVCKWDGVPLTSVVTRLRASRNATAVLVSGVDLDGSQSADSVEGASWIFPLSSLGHLAAFLAVRMNGDPLPADHGAPIRLVVPGWYGCTWIKWVNEIRLTTDDEPATSQMKEFAGRTHQTARHELARDYAPAEIQTAAMPVRVEKRRTTSGLEYRIVGIVWGGGKPVERLAIRFRADEAWHPFSICPAPTTHRTWSLWDYRWKPTVPGTYDISLSVPDASVPQRRLDAAYYMRQVRIEEI